MRKKNYNFQRDYERKVNTALRNLEICYLYQIFQNTSEVSRITGISRTTILKVINSDLFVNTNEGNYFCMKLDVPFKSLES